MIDPDYVKTPSGIWLPVEAIAIDSFLVVSEVEVEGFRDRGSDAEKA